MRGLGARGLGACGALLGALGCAAEVPSDGWTDQRVVAEIFAPSCGVSACHANPEPAAGLNLSTVEGVHATAIGRAPSIGAAPRLYPAIVMPGDSSRSFLIAKVTLPGADEGLPMPPTQWMLTDEAIAILRAWIDEMPQRATR